MRRTRNMLILLSVLGLLLCRVAYTQPAPTSTTGPDAAITATAPSPPKSATAAPIAIPVADTATPAPTNDAVQSWWQALLYDIIFNVIVPVFVPVMGALLFLLLRKLGLKIELETLDRLGKSAADYSEHKAKVWFKENGEKSSGAQKEDWAWELIESIDSKIKGKKKARNKLRAIILAKLGEAEQQAGTTVVAPAAPAEGAATTPASSTP